MIELSVSLASSGVVKVPGYEQLVRFGYTKNRGVYRLHVDATGEWEGLAIRAFWHVPDGKDPASSLVVDGYVAVPASVTAQPGSGCITFEGSDDTKNITSADLHYRVSANSGTEDGTEPEPGTPAWQQLVDAVHTDATAAEQAKTDAQTAAQQAGASAQKAGNALSDTITAKEDALKATKDAQTAANEATTSAGSADKSAQEAAGSLQELKNGIASGEFKGEPGTSPTVTVQDIAGGHRIVITDATGTSSVDVMDGKQGDPGKDATVDTTLTHEGEAADAKATGDAISAVKARQNILVGSETGNPISVDDAFPAPLCGLTVYGKSTQDGTPTPDAPVPIVSAGNGGSVAVKVTGKNLFYEQGFQEYFINNSADIVGLAVGNVSSVLQVVTGVKYCVTRSKIGTKFRVAVVNELPVIGATVRPSSAINADSKRQVEISATSKYMVIQCEDEAAFSELMVSLDSSTAYSPYREQLLTLPTPTGLPGIPVTSGGNYTDQQGQQWVCDEVDLERGVKVQRVKVLDIDNASLILYGSSNSYWYVSKSLSDCSLNNTGNKAAKAIMCQEFPVVSQSDETKYSYPIVAPYGHTNIVELRFRAPEALYATIEDFRQTIVGAKVYYPLATPIETQLTPAEIAAYKALTAYGPDTVVQAGDGAGIKLDYQRDVNLVVKNLEDAIASMT